MRVRKSDRGLLSLLLLCGIGVASCADVDCPENSPPEVSWDGEFADRDGGSVTVDAAKGLVTVVKDDRLRGKIVTVWKIRTGDEYAAARAAMSPR